MKITNISKAPTLVYPIGRPGGVLIEPGASYEGDFEDGQAAAHADDKARLTVEGFKPGRKVAAPAGDDKRVAELEAELATALATIERLTAELADLGDDPADADEGDELRQQAIGLGIKVDKRWTDETVQRKIDAKLAE